MSYVCVISQSGFLFLLMNKAEQFDDSLQALASFARVVSHPARLMILRFLAESKTCISGDISESLPLSRTTVSQHLKSLKEMGLIHGEIDGLKIHYCLCHATITSYLDQFDAFFASVTASGMDCATTDPPGDNEP